MLPLWRNRVCIVIDPDHLSMVKLGRGLKPKILSQFDEAIPQLSNINPDWQGVADKLAQVLGQPEWQSADAEIVLSNKLVRYAVIPTNTSLKKYAIREAFARHVLSKIYAQDSNQWALRMQYGKPSEPWLVSAIDQALIDRLKLICTSNNLKLGCITPNLAPLLNQYKKQITADSSWLVINETTSSLCVLIKNGEIIGVSNISHDHIHDLPVLLDRENLLNILPEPCKTVYLYTSFTGDLSFMQKAGYTTFKLEMPVLSGALENTLLNSALALSGVM